MRADPDFSAYVVARWSPVVRVLAVLGVPVARAADLAVAALARTLPDWARLRREGDADVELLRLVLDSWTRDHGTDEQPQEPVPVPAGRLLTQELETQLALLARLTEGLHGVEPTTRLAVVLHHVGELDRDQVAEVLGESRATVDYRLSRAAQELGLGPLDPACHEAAAAIDVPPASVDRVLAVAEASRRRRWLVSLAVAVVVVAAIGVTAVWTRPDPAPQAETESVDITPAANPLDISWWEDGLLHLQQGTVRVPELVQLVDTGVGVAYTDREGEVTVLGDDGLAQHPGRMDPDGALVAQPALGLVAWVDGDTEADTDSGAVVVYDVVRRRRYEAAGGAGTRLLGWDRQSLYLHREGGDHALTVGSGSTLVDTEVTPPEGTEGSALLDVGFGTELRLDAGTLTATQPFFSVTRVLPGTSGQLSRDGSFALTERDGVGPAVYDTRSGEPQGTWFSDDTWTPLAAAWTDSVRVVWVVDSHDGSYGLYECQPSRDWVDSFDPGSQPCSPRVDVDSVPVLAGTQPGLSTNLGTMSRTM